MWQYSTRKSVTTITYSSWCLRIVKLASDCCPVEGGCTQVRVLDKGGSTVRTCNMYFSIMDSQSVCEETFQFPSFRRTRKKNNLKKHHYILSQFVFQLHPSSLLQYHIVIIIDTVLLGRCVCTLPNTVHKFKDECFGLFTVRADTGTIGGSLSHEYHIPNSHGEDTLVTCQQ